jgi:hypothetical protein
MLSLPVLDIMPQVLKETIEQKKNNASLQPLKTSANLPLLTDCEHRYKQDRHKTFTSSISSLQALRVSAQQNLEYNIRSLYPSGNLLWRNTNRGMTQLISIISVAVMPVMSPATDPQYC